MLYEKTLSRKVVSVSSEAKADEPSKTNGKGVAKKKSRSCLTTTVEFLKKPFDSKKTESVDKSKDLASMGKIMNLMR